MATRRKRTTRADAPDVFVSYSHRDYWWRDWLLDEPVVSYGEGTIEVWSDQEIRASEDWYRQIQAAMMGARIAILLVTNEFLHSEFIRRVELPKILDARRRGEKRVLWIPIDYDQSLIEQKLQTLTSIQAACSPGNPLRKLRDGGAEEALVGVRRAIYDQILREIDEDWWRTQRALNTKYSSRKYEVIERLGDGKSHTAFVTRDHFLKRFVAVSSLRRTDGLPSFRRSLQHASRVDDIECFLTVYDASLDTNPPFMVRQYIEGSPLSERIRTTGVGVSFARDILLRIGEAVAQGHRRRFYHLNIKPSNIILDEYDRAFLSPLSRRHDYYQKLPYLWKTDRNDEDRAYAIPEFVGRALSHSAYAKCDQYLVGLVGYHMLTGRNPVRYAGEKPPRSIDEFSELAPIRRLGHCRNCPDVLADAIMRMIQRNPADRFDNLDDALELIRQFRCEDLGLAKDSYRRVANRSDWESRVLTSFYAELQSELRKPPQRKKALARFAELDMERQRAMLKEGVLLLLNFAEFDAANLREPTVLTRTAESHVHLRITRRDYQMFIKMLIDAIVANDPVCQSTPSQDASAIANEVRRAWERALKPGLDYMMHIGR